MHSSQKGKFIFWIIFGIVFLAQLIFTFNSFNQIRYEELAESVRNPYWLNFREIYDGISSNIGWYGTLLVIYKIFGFTLFSAKIFRLILAFFSLLSLALLLKKYLGYKLVIIPLITVVLSPTLLYFNMLQTSYGTDLQYLPIIIFLADSLDLKSKARLFASQAVFGFLSMLAAMSYPPFIFYLPALTVFYLWKINNLFTFPAQKFINIMLTLIAFASPLIIGFLYVKEKAELLNDPNVNGGIFRGAGSISLSLQGWSHNLQGLFHDLALSGVSYNFELTGGEFSGIYPWIAVILVLGISFNIIIRRKLLSFFTILIWITMIGSLLVTSLTLDPSNMPGMRRNTAILASFYILFIFVWFFINTNFKKSGLKIVVIILLSLIAFQHIMIFPANLSSLGNLSIFRTGYFAQNSISPERYLETAVNQIKKEDLKLSCINNENKYVNCRYSEMFAAVSGYCEWNNLSCNKVLGYDTKSQHFIPLNINLYKTYYFDH